MTGKTVILAALTALAVAPCARAQMMFLSEENMSPLAAALPGSPVLYDISADPKEVVEKIYQVGEQRTLTTENKYTLQDGKVTKIESFDLTTPEKPSLTTTIFAYDDNGRLVTMSVINEDSKKEQQRLQWVYDAAGHPDRAICTTPVSGYLLDKPGGKYQEVSGTVYAQYGTDKEGNINRVTARCVPQYAPYSAHYRKGGSPERLGANFKYALAGEGRYRQGSQFALPESFDGLTADASGTTHPVQKEFSYTPEGWLMQVVAHYPAYTDKSGNEVEEAEVETNYTYESDENGNWTYLRRTCTTDPYNMEERERTYIY